MDHQHAIRRPTGLRLTASPALVPAVGVLAGTCAAPHLIEPPLALLALLIGLGVALSSTAGRAIAALALGLFGVGLQAPEPCFDPRRPVELVAVVSGHPVAHPTETFLPAGVRRLRQGLRVTRVAFDLQVTIPPEVTAPAIGSRIRLRGYLRRSPGFANGSPSGPGPWRLRLKSGRLLRIDQPPGRLTAVAGALRSAAEAALEPFGSEPGPALVRALVLGDRSRLPKAWQQALRRSGLAHLLAVSGLHVGLLALLLLLPGALLPSRLRYLPALAGVGLYLLLVGPRPSVLRASIMALLALGALILDRPPQGLNALACCVALLVLHDPSITSRLGFRLSVAATAGILILAPVYTRRWRWPQPFIRAPLAVSLAAQLATLPWTLPLAGGLHPLAPLLNLVAIPYLGLVLLVAFAWLAVAVTASWASNLALPLLNALAIPLEGLARLPPGPAWLYPLALAPPVALVSTVAMVVGFSQPRRAARCGLLVWLLVQTGSVSSEAPIPEIVVLDVGQGDAIILRDGSAVALFDGGGWPHGDLGGRVLVPALAALGIRRLDAIVLTHPDLDHCRGLVDVARYLPVEEVWMGPGWIDDCAAEVLGVPASRWRVLWRGEKERLGRWRLEVLSPAAGLRRGRNDRSLVVSAEVGAYRVLLTGDVGARVEADLVRALGSDLQADILKVAHHGSGSSTSAAFLRAVRPRIAVVSAAPGNSHGHPHPAVLERLSSAGARVLRTDRAGIVRLRLGLSISISLPGSPRAGGGWRERRR